MFKYYLLFEVVMTNYKKNSLENSSSESFEQPKKEKSKGLEQNLNISNNIKNIWMDVGFSFLNNLVKNMFYFFFELIDLN